MRICSRKIDLERLSLQMPGRSAGCDVRLRPHRQRMHVLFIFIEVRGVEWCYAVGRGGQYFLAAKSMRIY